MLDEIISSTYIIQLMRVGIAILLGGVIGMEREHRNRPAGLRTHILVCVGSSVVMIISEAIFNRYSGIVNLDPARLGAQVISGIGFLGAGTIMRTGASVKGLTTAATLWVTACIGLAVGSGEYYLAVLSTFLVFFALVALSKVERITEEKRNRWSIHIEVARSARKLDEIEAVFRHMNIETISIRFEPEGPSLINNPIVALNFIVKPPQKAVLEDTLLRLKMIEGVSDAFRS